MLVPDPNSADRSLASGEGSSGEKKLDGGGPSQRGASDELRFPLEAEHRRLCTADASILFTRHAFAGDARWIIERMTRTVDTLGPDRPVVAYLENCSPFGWPLGQDECVRFLRKNLARLSPSHSYRKDPSSFVRDLSAEAMPEVPRYMFSAEYERLMKKVPLGAISITDVPNFEFDAFTGALFAALRQLSSTRAHVYVQFERPTLQSNVQLLARSLGRDLVASFIALRDAARALTVNSWECKANFRSHLGRDETFVNDVVAALSREKKPAFIGFRGFRHRDTVEQIAARRGLPIAVEINPQSAELYSNGDRRLWELRALDDEGEWRRFSAAKLFCNIATGGLRAPPARSSDAVASSPQHTQVGQEGFRIFHAIERSPDLDIVRWLEREIGTHGSDAQLLEQRACAFANEIGSIR